MSIVDGCLGDSTKSQNRPFQSWNYKMLKAESSQKIRFGYGQGFIFIPEKFLSCEITTENSMITHTMFFTLTHLHDSSVSQWITSVAVSSQLFAMLLTAVVDYIYNVGFRIRVYKFTVPRCQEKQHFLSNKNFGGRVVPVSVDPTGRSQQITKKLNPPRTQRQRQLADLQSIGKDFILYFVDLTVRS